MTLVDYRCPKCGHERRERHDALEVSHLCKPFHRAPTRLLKVTHPQHTTQQGNTT